jgi:hypothetical protein
MAGMWCRNIQLITGGDAQASLTTQAPDGKKYHSVTRSLEEFHHPTSKFNTHNICQNLAHEDLEAFSFGVFSNHGLPFSGSFLPVWQAQNQAASGEAKVGSCEEFFVQFRCLDV